VLELYNDQPLRVVNGPIGSIGYDPVRRLNRIVFTGKGNWRLEQSNDIPEQISVNGFRLTGQPNPTLDGKFQVHITSPVFVSASLEITNLSGKPLLCEPCHLKRGLNVIAVDLKEYPAGLYTILLTCPDCRLQLKIVRP